MTDKDNYYTALATATAAGTLQQFHSMKTNSICFR